MRSHELIIMQDLIVGSFKWCVCDGQIFKFVILMRFTMKINCELGGWGVKIEINFQTNVSTITKSTNIAYTLEWIVDAKLDIFWEIFRLMTGADANELRFETQSLLNLFAESSTWFVQTD